MLFDCYSGKCDKETKTLEEFLKTSEERKLQRVVKELDQNLKRVRERLKIAKGNPDAIYTNEEREYFRNWGKELEEKRATIITETTKAMRDQKALFGLGILNGSKVHAIYFQDFFVQSLAKIKDKQDQKRIEKKISELQNNWSIHDTITYQGITFYEHRFGDYRLLTYFTGSHQGKKPVVLILQVFRKTTQTIPAKQKAEAVNQIKAYENQ